MRGTGADISQITTPLCHKEEKQRNIVVLSGKMGDERVGAISNEVDGGGWGVIKKHASECRCLILLLSPL